MTRSTIDVSNPPRVDRKQREAVVRALEEKLVEEAPSSDYREHIVSEFKRSVCCEHRWQPVEPSKENTQFLQLQFEEGDLGDEQMYCGSCGATSLWEPRERGEESKLWAYDATSKFFGKPPPPPKPAAQREDRRK